MRDKTFVPAEDVRALAHAAADTPKRPDGAGARSVYSIRAPQLAESSLTVGQRIARSALLQ